MEAAGWMWNLLNLSSRLFLLMILHMTEKVGFPKAS